MRLIVRRLHLSQFSKVDMRVTSGPMRTRFRGFVGPLGDDLPSIFPIVAAVLLFIGTLVYANGLVEGKNRLLETRQAALGLSYIVTEKGLINNRTNFETTACNDHLKKYALSNRIQFAVTVKRYCQTIQFYYPKSSPQPEKAKLSPAYIEKNDAQMQGQTWAYCTNVVDKNGNPPASGLLAVPEDAVVLTYPIAVPCPLIPQLPTNGLGLVNVIAWKERGKT